MQDSKNCLQYLVTPKMREAQCHPRLSHPKEGNLMVYNQFQARTGPEMNAAPPAAAVWKVPRLSCHSQQKPSIPLSALQRKELPRLQGIMFCYKCTWERSKSCAAEREMYRVRILFWGALHWLQTECNKQHLLVPFPSLRLPLQSAVLSVLTAEDSLSPMQVILTFCSGVLAHILSHCDHTTHFCYQPLHHVINSFSNHVSTKGWSGKANCSFLRSVLCYSFLPIAHLETELTVRGGSKPWDSRGVWVQASRLWQQWAVNVGPSLRRGQDVLQCSPSRIHWQLLKGQPSLNAAVEYFLLLLL